MKKHVRQKPKFQNDDARAAAYLIDEPTEPRVRQPVEDARKETKATNPPIRGPRMGPVINMAVNSAIALRDPHEQKEMDRKEHILSDLCIRKHIPCCPPRHGEKC
jgi:hypothetical protein